MRFCWPLGVHCMSHLAASKCTCRGRRKPLLPQFSVVSSEELQYLGPAPAELAKKPP